MTSKERLALAVTTMIIEAIIQGVDLNSIFAKVRESGDVTPEMWDSVMSNWDDTMKPFKDALEEAAPGPEG